MSSLSSNLATMNDRRRSQRVLLRIPIAVIAPGPDKKLARENTNTFVVNAHGALISLELPVSPGQVVILQNPETSEEQPCRIVRVDRAPKGKSEVGIEFLKPAPNFWRVAFPPSDWVPHTPEITGDTF
jgi:PilZ domain